MTQEVLPLRVFISYARDDGQFVQELHDHLKEVGFDVWYDRDLVGGDDWWRAILSRVRESDMVIFVLGPDSATSRACRRELAYAHDLGRTILPIMVREVDIEDGPDQIQSINVLGFAGPTPSSWMKLVTAVLKAPRGAPLPEPLPVAPAAPMANLSNARAKADAASLSEPEQRAVLGELGVAIRDKDDRSSAVAVLAQLRARQDLLKYVADEIDELLLAYPVESVGRVSPLIRSLVADLEDGACTAILGSGLTDWLFGTRRDFAQKWAAEYPFGVTPHWTDDLPQIAQYAAITYGDRVVRNDLAAFYGDQLRKRFPHLAGGDEKKTLGELAVAAYETEAPSKPNEPHRVLADLPCNIYINAAATTLLAEALRKAGRHPVVDYCRWKPELERDSKLPLEDPTYQPSATSPLVFHIFGTIDRPESMVITEDEYFDFLAAIVESDPNSPIIPPVVQEALASTSLLFLGFGLQDWDLRILLRSVIRREWEARKGLVTKNVATEMDAITGARSMNDARDYVVRYFQGYKPSIEIEWATVAQFVSQLAQAWGARSGG